MKNFAFLFPGQGSQSLNMMDGLSELKIVIEIFNQASKVIDIDLWEMLHEKTPENINNTLNTQPLLLTASYATYLAWLEKSNRQLPNFVAGHSLGEYNALVASEVISFTDAVKLVRNRAKYMQEAVKPGEGAMAAVLGLDDETVIKSCSEIMNNNKNEVVQGVNFNSVGQIVIAGTRQAVEQASILLKERGARKVIPLAVSVPSHCELMRPAAEKLATDLENIVFNPPKIPIVQNVNGQITTEVSEIKNGLIQQLYSPVLWTTSVKTLANNQIDILIECGPGKVLSGLNKRLHEQAQLINLHNQNDLDNLFILINQ